MAVDNALRVVAFQEKPEDPAPMPGRPDTALVSMGIYVYEPEVLNYIESGKYLDFPDLVVRLIEKGKRVCACPCDCVWLDIGRPDDYARAQEMFAEKREEFIRV